MSNNAIYSSWRFQIVFVVSVYTLRGEWIYSSRWVKKLFVKTENGFNEDDFSFSWKPNNVFTRTKQRFFENKVRFLEEPSMVFVEKPADFMELFRRWRLLKLLVCKRLKRSVKKSVFSEVQFSIVFSNLGEKVALKTPKVVAEVYRRKAPKITLLYIVEEI